MPKYAKFMKNIQPRKKKFDQYKMVILTEECLVVLQKKLSQKLKDPGSFFILCHLGNISVSKVLCDLGASINLMPLSVSGKLDIKEVQPTTISLQQVDCSLAYPYGIVEDVLVKVDKFIFLVDFVVLELEEDANIPIILNRFCGA